MLGKDARNRQPLLQLLAEQLEVDGLGNACIAASQNDPFLIRYHRVRCHCDDRNIRQVWFSAEPRGEG
jgi:hypothetical protein